MILNKDADHVLIMEKVNLFPQIECIINNNSNPFQKEKKFTF